MGDVVLGKDTSWSGPKWKVTLTGVGTVDKLLLGKLLQIVGSDGVVSLSGGNTSKRPAGSTRSLGVRYDVRTSNAGP